MKSEIKNPGHFWSGLIFVSFGILAVLISDEYPRGSTIAMGPGYFPTALGYILIVLGVTIIATSFKFKGDGREPFAWCPMILLSVAFAVFGWAIDRFGFIPALLALIGICSLSIKESKWIEILIMSALLIVGSCAIFIWGLKLPFPLFWWR